MNVPSLRICSAICVAMLVLCASAQADVVGLWRFEGAVNDTVPDASGYGHPAVLLNGASIGFDVPGVCILSDGVACTQDLATLSLAGGQAAAVADAPQLHPAQLTIEAWIKPEPGAWVVVGKQFGDGCCSNSFQIELWDALSGGLTFLICDPWGGNRYALSSVVPPLGAWSHVAGTWDGQTMKLYLNGEVLATAPYQGAIGYDSNPIIIGADDDGAGVPGCCYFVGAIDEVRLSDRALTPDEFVQLCPPEQCATPVATTSWSVLKTLYR
jgi:hypothetical protein